ncbi:MAG: hypothetical protein ACRC5A_03295 [Enterobacteriaceae bacterium]
MDLQLTRNLEEFFALTGRGPIMVDDKVECHWKPFGLRMEAFDRRLLMTSWLLEMPVYFVDAWLSRWDPEAFKGVPQRIFVVKQRLLISCLCPGNSQALDWYNLYQAQLKFLNKVNRGAYL